MNLPIANGKYRKPAEVLAGFLVCSAASAWFFDLYLSLQYDVTKPRQFSLLSGRIYELSNHGHIVYLTQAEHTKLTYLTILAFGLMATAILVINLFVEKTRWNRRGVVLIHEHRQLYGSDAAPWEKKLW
jgi:hypothetical protein